LRLMKQSIELFSIFDSTIPLLSHSLSPLIALHALLPVQSRDRLPLVTLSSPAGGIGMGPRLVPLQETGFFIINDVDDFDVFVVAMTSAFDLVVLAFAATAGFLIADVALRETTTAPPPLWGGDGRRWEEEAGPWRAIFSVLLFFFFSSSSSLTSKNEIRKKKVEGA
jgi:hypothetical protein